MAVAWQKTGGVATECLVAYPPTQWSLRGPAAFGLPSVQRNGCVCLSRWPWLAVVSELRELAETLEAGGQTRPHATHTRPGGQQVLDVFPTG